MHVAAIAIDLHLPGCASLKEKRSRLKPLLIAIRRRFNVSAAEIEHNDFLQAAGIACVAVSNDHAHCQRVLGRIPKWIETRRPDITVIDHQIEFL